MTLQLTESECEALRWLFGEMLGALKAATAYSSDRDSRRELARRIEDLDAVEVLLRHAGVREAA